jgi:hypothetical protein
LINPINGELCITSLRKSSTVLKWLGVIRSNAHKFATGQLEQPPNMALEEGTVMSGQHFEALMTTKEHKMKGCKVSLTTYNKHVRAAKRAFDTMHMNPGVFPMQNCLVVRESLLDAYKMARFTQSSGHEWSEGHLRFACFLHALAPHVVPHAQGNNQAQANQIAMHVHKQFVLYEYGFQWRNALKFSGLLERVKRADAEVQQDGTKKRHKRMP